jgi:hypothetical protein
MYKSQNFGQTNKIERKKCGKSNPLASGSVMLEFTSREAYVKALNIGIIDIAGI